MKTLILTKNGKAVTTGETPTEVLLPVVKMLEPKAVYKFCLGDYYPYKDSQGNIWSIQEHHE